MYYTAFILTCLSGVVLTIYNLSRSLLYIPFLLLYLLLLMFGSHLYFSPPSTQTAGGGSIPTPLSLPSLLALFARFLAVLGVFLHYLAEQPLLSALALLPIFATIIKLFGEHPTRVGPRVSVVKEILKDTVIAAIGVRSSLGEGEGAAAKVLRLAAWAWVIIGGAECLLWVGKLIFLVIYGFVRGRGFRAVKENCNKICLTKGGISRLYFFSKD